MKFCGCITLVLLYTEGRLLAIDVFMLAVGIQLVLQSSIQLGLLELHFLPSVLYKITRFHIPCYK